MKSFNKFTIEDLKYCRKMESQPGIVNLLLGISKEEALQSCYANINILINNENAITQILKSCSIDVVLDYYKSALRTFFCYDNFIPMIEKIVNENISNEMVLINHKKLLAIYDKKTIILQNLKQIPEIKSEEIPFSNGRLF